MNRKLRNLSFDTRVSTHSLCAKRLISLIKTSHDDDVIAIACYDLGEFVRHYSNGRAIAKRLGGKEVVLQATEHQNPDVQTQALLCVSKILIQNWSVRNCIVLKVVSHLFRIFCSLALLSVPYY